MINPKGTDAYVGRASVFDALNDRDKASREFDLAIGVDPDRLETYWARAEMALRWGEKELAIKNYEKVLKINAIYAHARKALDRLGISAPAMNERTGAAAWPFGHSHACGGVWCSQGSGGDKLETMPAATDITSARIIRFRRPLWSRR